VPGNISVCVIQRFSVLTPVCLSLTLALQENLRQLCVFQLANESGQSYRWWEYVTKFGEECTMSGNNYNEACAERVCQFCSGFDSLKFVWFGTGSAPRPFVWVCCASLPAQLVLYTHPDSTLVYLCLSLLPVHFDWKGFRSWFLCCPSTTL